MNVRGTFVCSQQCFPYLKKSAEAGRNPHILALSPPLNLNPKWLAPHVAYTIAKYGMSLCVLGMAEEWKASGICVNGLWPRTVIDTAALNVIPGAMGAMGRTPEILADAAYFIFNGKTTGRIHMDDEVLAAAGITDLSKYSVTPGNTQLMQDIFLD